MAEQSARLAPQPMSLWEEKYRRLQDLKSERQSWEAHWKELARFFLPRRGRWLDESTNRGGKKNQDLIDPTPKMAARTLASGMHAGSTNPSTQWFALQTPDAEMMEYPSVSRWLYSVQQRMMDVFAKSNLYKILPQVYLEAGVFGTAPILMLEDDQKVMRFEALTIGSYYLAQDQFGKVDTCYREYKQTTRQMVRAYGAACPPQVIAEYERRALDQWHDVLHAIEPRNDRDVHRADARNMPFASTYLSREHRLNPLRDSGFEENPIAVFRWETTAEDTYGSSPGMDALGSAKAMQVQQKRKAQAIDKHVDPPMVADPALESQPSTLLPGGVTYSGFTPNGSAPRFQPAYVIKPELQGLLLDIEDIRDLVRQCMFVDLFLMFSSTDRRQITAEEIAKRYEEKLLMLGPALGNHKTDLIEPIVERTFSAMARKGLLPEPPPELEGVELKVEMTSMLHQAQKMVALGSMERFTGFVGALARAQAEAGLPVTAFDKVDIDQSIDEFGGAIGVPPTMIRSDDDVAALRKSREDAAQARQMQQSAPLVKDTAAAAKMLSETKVGGASALDQLAGAA